MFVEYMGRYVVCSFDLGCWSGWDWSFHCDYFTFRICNDFDVYINVSNLYKWTNQRRYMFLLLITSTVVRIKEISLGRLNDDWITPSIL
jgi:hypothetical protein